MAGATAEVTTGEKTGVTTGEKARFLASLGCGERFPYASKELGSITPCGTTC
jgi:hypothetical protein